MATVIPRTIHTATTTMGITARDGSFTSSPAFIGITVGAFITGIAIGGKAARDFERIELAEESTPTQFSYPAPGNEFPKDREFRALLKENTVVQRIVVVGCEEIIQVGNHFVILRVDVRQHV